jgi:AraC-like DNA-binding protein
MAGLDPASAETFSTALLVNPSPAHLGVTNAVLWGRGSGGHHVRGYPGPLSLKAVLRGRGVWETDEGRHTLDAGSWLVLNDGHAYSLTIERGQPVETFCVFFARGYVEATKASLVRPARALLDDPRAPLEPHSFREVPRPHGLPVTSELLALREALGRSEEPMATEDRLLALSRALVATEVDLDRAAARLPALRQATRDELLRRLLRGRIFAEDALAEPLSLARIAREAALSPFHFHRLFRGAFGETPSAYVRRRRLERARDALLGTDRPVTEVCLDAGFASLGSFSTLFRARFGASPREVRTRRRR